MWLWFHSTIYNKIQTRNEKSTDNKTIKFKLFPYQLLVVNEHMSFGLFIFFIPFLPFFFVHMSKCMKNKSYLKMNVKLKIKLEEKVSFFTLSDSLFLLQRKNIKELNIEMYHFCESDISSISLVKQTLKCNLITKKYKNLQNIMKLILFMMLRSL